MNSSNRPNPTTGEATLLLRQISEGDRDAAERLLPIVYQELRRLAESRMARLPPGHTLQPTALVHEVYLDLIGNEDPGWNSKAHFFGAAAQAMREILVDHARRKGRQKRGGDRKRVSLGNEPTDPITDSLPADEILAIDEAIERLRTQHPRPAEVVVCRYFAGMNNAMTASALDVSERTVERDWRFARAWLHKELSDEGLGIDGSRGED